MSSSLTGQYYFRHLQISTDDQANLTEIRSALGTLMFSPGGSFTFTGKQQIGSASPLDLTGNGNYSIDAAGTVTITNPEDLSSTINARLGAEALLGSSTEAGSRRFDLFAAVPAGAGFQNSALSGHYFAINLGLPSGSADGIRSSFFSFQADGAGKIAPFTVSGHSRAQSSSAPLTQDVTAANYSINPDGSGAIQFPSGGTLLSGAESVFVSASGNLVVGGGSGSSAQDFFLAVKAATNSSWTGEFWSAGLRYVPGVEAEAYTGSLNVIPQLNNATFTRRIHQSGVLAPFTFTGVNAASVVPDGNGILGLSSVGLGAAGQIYLSQQSSPADPSAFDIAFGIRLPTIPGSGFFLSPLAILNGASFAPPVNSVSPGEFVTLFVSGLPAQTAQGSLPYPRSLGGISVTVNGVTAPISFVNSAQINVLVPYATAGSTASFVVTSGGKTSNSVTVPLTATTPGIFSQNGSGTGPGAVTHADFSLITPDSPAHRGETILIFLTGLGAVQNPPPDGAASTGTPLSFTLQTPRVLIGSAAGAVAYSGLAPGFPGLYQINVTVPAAVPLGFPSVPLAIQTPEAFHDMIDLPVQ